MSIKTPSGRESSDGVPVLADILPPELVEKAVSMVARLKQELNLPDGNLPDVSQVNIDKLLGLLEADYRALFKATEPNSWMGCGDVNVMIVDNGEYHPVVTPVSGNNLVPGFVLTPHPTPGFVSVRALKWICRFENTDGSIALPLIEALVACVVIGLDYMRILHEARDKHVSEMDTRAKYSDPPVLMDGKWVDSNGNVVGIQCADLHETVGYYPGA